MAIWYMVKRLDTGEVNGHNTWRYNPVTSNTVNIGEVAEMRNKRTGDVTHLIVHVDADDFDEDGAQFMARVSFDMHESGEDTA